MVGDGGAQASAGELGGRTGRLASWVDDLRRQGVLRRGGHIEGPELRVRRADGRATVVPLPEDVGAPVRSWFLIDADGLDAAVHVARSCPEADHGDVRVLPVSPEARLP